MKTCQPHGYNPPSRCPNCKIHRKRARQNAAIKGHETRKTNAKNQQLAQQEQQKEKLARHGWLS